MAMRTLGRTLVFLLLASALAAVSQPLAERASLFYTLATEGPAAALPSPVAAQRSHFVDSWGNARSGGRRHQGIDIFARRDTPVLSTTNGLVLRVGTNNLGGQVVWILGPGLERHYYAHLNRYGAFRVGDRVQPGDVIGYTGNTGNARGGPAHLHYGIYRAGAAQNPYPRLAGRPRQAVSVGGDQRREVRPHRVGNPLGTLFVWMDAIRAVQF
jgi:peptidoglycan LD-endopeptidase LytH